ncbi:hypothetical protein V3C99_000180, partial [Haemonchus contortus]
FIFTEMMHICCICYGLCRDSDGRRCKNKETLLILLSIMLEKNVVTIPQAQDLYANVNRSQLICKSHYQEAVSYIGDLVTEMCGGVVNDFFIVQCAVDEVVARFEPHRQAIDASLRLKAGHLALFYRDHIKSDWIISVLSQKGKLSLGSFSKDTGRSSINNAKTKEMSRKTNDLYGTSECDENQPSSSSTNSFIELMTTPCDSSTDSQAFPELNETDPKLLDQPFVIKGRQLLELFRFCPSCGAKISDSRRCVSLTAVGTAPIVHYICTACSPFEKRFEGQAEENCHPEGISSTNSVKTVADALSMISQCGDDEFVSESLKRVRPDSAIRLDEEDETDDIIVVSPGPMNPPQTQKWNDHPPEKRTKEEYSDVVLIDDDCGIASSLSPMFQQDPEEKKVDLVDRCDLDVDGKEIQIAEQGVLVETLLGCSSNRQPINEEPEAELSLYDSRITPVPQLYRYQNGKVARIG